MIFRLLLKNVSRKVDEKIWSVFKSKLNIICHVYHVERLSFIKSYFCVFSLMSACEPIAPPSREALRGVLFAFRKWSSTITLFRLVPIHAPIHWFCSFSFSLDQSTCKAAFWFGFTAYFRCVVILTHNVLGLPLFPQNQYSPMSRSGGEPPQLSMTHLAQKA